MKVLFIYPHTLGFGDIPIALTTLSAVLHKAGHEVRVFNCSRYANVEYVLTKKEDYGMVKPAPKPPVVLPELKRLSDLKNDLSGVINEYRPELIGVTATTAIFPLGLECCKIAKNALPESITIFGGIHPTICPDEVIAENSVDIVCIGEGEDVIVELCNTLDQKKSIRNIKNLWVKDPDNPERITRNKLRPFIDMNNLPVQDFQNFSEYEFYRPFDGNVYKMLHTELSRGCVFDCSYCVNHHLKAVLSESGRYHRLKSPEIAVRQIKELKSKYNFQIVRFWDEDFTVFPSDYIKKLSVLYRKEIGLPFLIYAGTRSITEEKVSYLKKMGCVTIAMGIESGNYWMRKYVLNRNITDENIIEKFQIVKRSGIRVTTYNMIGFPFETRDMVFDTIELNRKVKAAMSGVWPFKPFPKTRLTSLAKEYGMIKKDPDYCSIESEMCTPYLNEKDINGLVRTFSFYVKVPRRLFPLLEKCEKDEAIAKQKLSSLVKYLK